MYVIVLATVEIYGVLERCVKSLNRRENLIINYLPTQFLCVVNWNSRLLIENPEISLIFNLMKRVK